MFVTECLEANGKMRKGNRTETPKAVLVFLASTYLNKNFVVCLCACMHAWI